MATLHGSITGAGQSVSAVVQPGALEEDCVAAALELLATPEVAPLVLDAELPTVAALDDSSMPLDAGRDCAPEEPADAPLDAAPLDAAPLDAAPLEATAEVPDVAAAPLPDAVIWLDAPAPEELLLEEELLPSGVPAQDAVTHATTNAASLLI